MKNSSKQIYSLVTAEAAVKKQSKTASFDINNQVIQPDQGYSALSQVTITGLDDKVNITDTDDNAQTIDSMTIDDGELNIVIEASSNSDVDLRFPKVKNLQISSSYIATWSAPSTDDYSAYLQDYQSGNLQYYIFLNGTQITSVQYNSLSYDLKNITGYSSYNRNGANSVDIRLGVMLSDKQLDQPSYYHVNKFNNEYYDLGVYRAFTANVAVGTNIYIFGGATGSNSNTTSYCVNTILKFDTLTNTTTTLDTTLPVALAGIAACAVGTDIYLFGGATNAYQYFNASSTYVNTVYKFDTLTETITTLTPLTNATIANADCRLIDNDIYLIGYNAVSSKTSFLKYNLINMSDTLITALPTGFTGIGSYKDPRFLIIYDNKIYFNLGLCKFGDTSFYTSGTGQIWYYDITNDTMSKTINSVSQLYNESSRYYHGAPLVLLTTNSDYVYVLIDAAYTSGGSGAGNNYYNFSYKIALDSTNIFSYEMYPEIPTRITVNSSVYTTYYGINFCFVNSVYYGIGGAYTYSTTLNNNSSSYISNKILKISIVED